MRVLITGASGLLGKYLMKFAPEGVELVTVGRGPVDDPPPSSSLPTSRKLDLLDFDGVRGLFDKEHFEGVLHAAAEGNVDKVQGSISAYEGLNVRLPGLLAELTEAQGSHLVHLSSNAVFGGRRSAYSDFDALTPINDYGLLKARAEQQVLENNPRASVVRPILMYGWPNKLGRKNIAQIFVERLSRGESVSALQDVVSQPLYAADCARAVWSALFKGVAGPVNVSGAQTMSIYEFALTVAEGFDLDPSLVTPVSFSDMGELSPRPERTLFSLDRLHSELDIFPVAPIDGLREMRAELSST